MTRALYYDLPLRLDFTATVTAADGPRVQLDATAFYPEGGGQPGDVGVLSWPDGSVRVTATRKTKATGDLWHELDGAAPPTGTAVRGVVDAGTRWRHTQRHSGEHLLAQALVRVNPAFGVEAVSMTSPECTLDLRGDPGEEDVLAAEALLRETLGRGDLTLSTPVVSEDDLGRYPLRRESKVRGQVRLVIFGDAGSPFDVSACGGTHVPRAAMAAPVVVLRTERIKGGLTRVVFMAGEEASAYLSGVYRDTRALAQSFSVPVARVTERVDALRDERGALQTELDALRRVHAQALVAGTAVQSLRSAPLRALSVSDPALLLPVLSAAGPDEVVAAVTPGGRCGVGSGRADVDAGALLRHALARTSGKGGGKPGLAQGQTEQPGAFLDTVAQVLAER